MEEIRIEPVRNIALVSNLGAGKTSLAEALLYTGGAIPSLSGKYVFGDFESGRIWALSELATGAWRNEELLDTTIYISSFGEDAGLSLRFTKPACARPAANRPELTRIAGDVRCCRRGALAISAGSRMTDARRNSQSSCGMPASLISRAYFSRSER